MVKYHNPKTGKTVEAKNLKEARKAFKGGEKPAVKKPAIKVTKED